MIEIDYVLLLIRFSAASFLLFVSVPTKVPNSKRSTRMSLDSICSCDTRSSEEIHYYCVLSSFPIEYETIFPQSIFVRVTGSCRRNALNVVSDIV